MAVLLADGAFIHQTAMSGEWHPYSLYVLWCRIRLMGVLILHCFVGWKGGFMDDI